MVKFPFMFIRSHHDLVELDELTIQFKESEKIKHFKVSVETFHQATNLAVGYITALIFRFLDEHHNLVAAFSCLPDRNTFFISELPATIEEDLLEGLVLAEVRGRPGSAIDIIYESPEGRVCYRIDGMELDYFKSFNRWKESKEDFTSFRTIHI